MTDSLLRCLRDGLGRWVVPAAILLLLTVSAMPLVSTASTPANVMTETTQDYLDILAVDTHNPGVIYGANGQKVAMMARVYKSVNAGETWTAVGTIDTSMYVTAVSVDLNPANPNTVYAAGFCAGVGPPSDPSYGALFKSTNGGTTFTKVGSNRPWVIYDVVAAADGTLYIAMGMYGQYAVWRSTNGGTLWGNYTGIMSGYDVSVLEPDPNNASVLYAAGGYGGLYKTTNKAVTWQQLLNYDNEAPAKDNMITSVAVDPERPDIVYAGLSGGDVSEWGLIKSTNGGEDWSVMAAGLPKNTGGGETGVDDGVKSIVVNPADRDMVYAIAGSRTPSPNQRPYRSADGGHTWQTMSLSRAGMQGFLLAAVPPPSGGQPVVVMDGLDSPATKLSRFVDPNWFEVRYPNGGETVSGDVTVTAEGSIGTTPSAVSFAWTRGLNTEFIATDTQVADGWSATWPTSWVAAGNNYRIMAYAQSSTGTVRANDSSDSTFTVQNPVTIPSIVHVRPSAGAEVGGDQVLLYARETTDTANVINKVKYFVVDETGHATDLGAATNLYGIMYEWDLWPWATYSGGFPDGDYRAVARAFHSEGGKDIAVTSSTSGPFAVKNRPDLTIARVRPSPDWYDPKVLWGNVTITTNVTDYANLIKKVSFSYRAPGAPGWTPIADDTNLAGGWGCTWDTSKVATPDAAGYAVKAEAFKTGGVAFIPTVEDTKTGYTVQNAPWKITYPAEGDLISLPITIRSQMRPDIAGAQFVLCLNELHTSNVLLSGPGLAWTTLTPGKTSGNLSSFHIHANHALGSAQSGTFSIFWGSVPISVTPTGGDDAAHEMNGYIDMSATISDFPADQLEGMRFHVGTTNSYEDTTPADGFKWRFDTTKLEDSTYPARVEVKSAGEWTDNVWNGVYRIHNNVLKPVVYSIEGPPSEPRMKDTYHVKVYVKNPDAYPQKVTITLHETATVNSMASDWADFDMQPEDYKHRVNGDLSNRHAIFSETYVISGRNATHTYDFPVRHDWRWLEPTENMRLGGTISKLALAGGGAIAKKTVSWGSKASKVFGVLTYVIEAGLRVGTVFSAAPAMDYDYEISSNIPGMTGISPDKYSIVSGIPNSKVVLLFDSYAASTLATYATATGIAAASSGVGIWFAAGCFAIEGANMAISYFAFNAAKDPDPDYTDLSSPADVTVSELEDLQSGVLKSAGTHSVDVLNHLKDAERAFARSEGAAEDDNHYWEIRQLEAAQAGLDLASDDLSQAVRSMDLFYGGLEAEGRTMTAEDVIEAQGEIGRDGLPDMEERILSDAGFSAEDITAVARLAATAPPEEVADEEALFGQFAKVANTLGDAADELGGEKQEMASEIPCSLTGPTTVKYPSRVRLIGHIGFTQAMTITAWAKPAGATTYTSTGVSVPAGYHGAFTLSLAPSKNTYYKMRWDSGDVFLGTPRLVKVAPKVSMSARRYGSRIRLSGYLSPKHVRRTLTIYRYVRRHWVRWTTTRTNSRGAYTRYLSAPRRVKVRVRFGGDSNHTVSYSASRTL